MIAGVVNANLEAIIRVAVRDASRASHDIDALVDTGFNGSLTLPQRLIEALGLQWYTRATITLANGAEEEVDVYAATVIWNGVPRRILVEATDTEPLLGMRLLLRHSLRIEVVDGGNVLIEAMTK
jgi:clan AA aspartic protease